jgi:2-polyprenyl-3-methyl-5-hydroxy-6-metoxy-1,4-benzoquinol methylase
MTHAPGQAATPADYENFLRSQQPLFLVDQPGDERLYIKASMERYALELSVLSDYFLTDPKGPAAWKTLDVGCYPGHLALLLRHFWGADITGVGITSYGPFLERMAAHGMRFMKMNVETQQLPFDDRSFDLVLFTEVIEHLYNPFSILSEMGRVIKPHGMLLLSTPNMASLRNRIRFLQGKIINQDLLANDEKIANPAGTRELEYPVHARLYMPVELTILLNKYGFELRGEWYQPYPVPDRMTIKERLLRLGSRLSPAFGDNIVMLAVKA